MSPVSYFSYFLYLLSPSLTFNTFSTSFSFKISFRFASLAIFVCFLEEIRLLSAVVFTAATSDQVTQISSYALTLPSRAGVNLFVYSHFSWSQVTSPGHNLLETSGYFFPNQFLMKSLLFVINQT